MSRLYPNAPVVAVGVVVLHDGRVLLVRRGRPPSKGLWAVPGGSVELGESLAEAAEREVLEETGVRVRAGEPVYAFDGIDRDDRGALRHHYVVVDVLAAWVAGDPVAADDADEAGWFAADELDRLELSEVTRHLLRDRLGFGGG